MIFRAIAMILVVGIVSVLGLVILDMDEESGGLNAAVASRINEAGVEHPVTAVLLNFRAYDTWLEVVVLLLAVLGMMVLRQSLDIPPLPPADPTGPVLIWLTRILGPFIIIAGGYLLWAGSSAPGGAFQAGAVIGSGSVLFRLAGYQGFAVLNGPILRGSLGIGIVAFCIVAAGLLLMGRALLDFPTSIAGTLIVLIEIFVTWSVAVTFATLFSSSRPRTSERGNVEYGA